MDVMHRNALTERIQKLFDDQELSYTIIDHEPCRTSQESFDMRKEYHSDGVIGAKALVVKCYPKGGLDPYFAIFVLSGFDQLDATAVRSHLNLKKHRFATPDELNELTDGLVPGCVPPFGAELFSEIQELYVDEQLLQESVVGFNAASLCCSIIVETEKFRSVISPSEVFSYGKSPEA